MTTSADPPAGTFDPARALRSVGGLGLVGGGIVGAHLLGIGLPCPLRAVTGIQCPFCGATRAAAAVLRGDLMAAWSLNAWVMTLAVILGVCAGAWILELVGGPRIRLPRFLGPVTQTRVYWWCGVSGAVFMVVRNLL